MGIYDKPIKHLEDMIEIKREQAASFEAMIDGADDKSMPIAGLCLAMVELMADIETINKALLFLKGRNK